MIMKHLKKLVLPTVKYYLFYTPLLVNVNYLEPYSEIEVDSKISPLICSCYLGRLEIVKLLL